MNGNEAYVGWETFPLREEILSFETAILFTLVATLTLIRARRGEAGPRGYLPFVALAAAGLGLSLYLTLEWGVPRLALALVTAASIGVAFLGPAYAACVLIAFLVLRPWEIMETNEVMATIPRTLGWLSVGTVLAYFPARKGWGALLHPAAIFPIAMAAWLYLGASGTSDPESVRELLRDAFIPILVVYFVTLAAVEDRGAIDAIAACFVIAVTGIAWIAIYRTLGEERLVVDLVTKRLKAVGLLEDPNDASALSVMIFPFAVQFALGRGTPWIGRIGALAAVITTPVLIRMAQSRGALLAFFSCGAAYVVIRSTGRRVKPWVAIALFVVLLIPVGVRFNRAAEDTELSTQSRLNYWEAALKMAAHKPLFGVGFGQYPVLYDEYAPEKSAEWGKRTAHSSWALILAEGGVPALLLMWSLVGAALIEAWRLRREMPALFCSLIGYSVAISLLSHTYYLYPYALFALALGAGRVLRARRADVAAVGSSPLAVAAA